MRLDHLLSKEEVRVVLLLICQGQIDVEGEMQRIPSIRERCMGEDIKRRSSGDALMGHTRSHPEHDG